MSTRQAAFFDNQLWTIDQLAKFLDVPAATIRDWVYKRLIPFVKAGRHVRFKPSDIHRWLEKHLRTRCSPATIENAKSVLRADLLPTFGDMKHTAVHAHHIDAFLENLNGRLSNIGINRRLQLIRTIYNYHIRRRVISYNPADAVALLKIDPKPIRFWTLEEARHLLEHAKKKYKGTEKEAIYLLYLIGLNTGMRLGEMVALKWSSVDFQNHLITVCRTCCAASRRVFETTKGKRIRHVPMNDVLCNALKEAYVQRRNSEWILLTPHGCMLHKDNLYHSYWLVDIKHSGVSKIRIHDMRHTFASHFMMNGGELYKLQAILGHANIRTTQQYTHLSKAFLRENSNIVSFEAEGNLIKGICEEYRKCSE